MKLANDVSFYLISTFINSLLGTIDICTGDRFVSVRSCIASLLGGTTLASSSMKDTVDLVTHTFLLLILTGAVITSNITDKILCPGESVVYTCVSQGSTQRWRIENEGYAMPIELVYRRTEEPGSMSSKSSYRFTLVSTEYSHFESTVAVVIAVSMNNTVLECTGATQRDRVTIQIAGHRHNISTCIVITNVVGLTFICRHTNTSPEPSNQSKPVSQSLFNRNF